MRPWLAGLAMLLLAACASQGNLTTGQALFDIQTRYTNLAAVVLRYVQQPICLTEPSLVPCADPSVVEVLQHADHEAYQVLAAAEIARGTVDAETYRALALAAVSRLRSEIAAYAIREALQ